MQHTVIVLKSIRDCVFETEAPCNPGWLRTHYVDQIGLKLTEIHLPLLPNARIKDMWYYSQLQ